jgi:hypothetical protein
MQDADTLVSDVSGYEQVLSSGKQVRQDLINGRKEQYKEWCHETLRAIDDPSQALKFVSRR